jgi:transcriptional regulator with XRE-family HTH domain
MSIPRNMIGPKLRQIRLKRGLTQVELVAMCQRKGWDISRETLAKVESQYRWVSDFEVMFFALVLEISTRELLPDFAPEAMVKKWVAKLERRLG